MQNRRGGGEVAMGYPVDQIGTETKLFSLIGANAIENDLARYFNAAFQALDADCKMMPLNIREDDLGFFLHGLKDSKIFGAYLEEEYWEIVYNLLQEGDEEVQFCGICDTIDIVDNRYTVHLTQGRAMAQAVDEIENISGKTVTIAGATPSAKSFLYHLRSYEPAKLILANDIVEELLAMASIIPENISHDIVRIQNNYLDKKSDIVFNFTEGPLTCETKHHFDLHNMKDQIMTHTAQIKAKEWSE